MVYSRVDQFYRSLLLSKFFTKGWGKPDNLKRIFEFRKILSNRESCQTLVDRKYPITIDKDYKDGDCRIVEGHFISPFVRHMPGIMPKEVETASFQALLPIQWQHPTLKPICIHLAGTGDHFFWRRRLFTARPLLKDAGIASILLENPYYGSRKPKTQLRSSLHNVSDLFVMGGALVLESIALLHWCERQGWGPFGLSGVSMGGHNASAAAAVWYKPISVVPFLSWTTASTCLTKMASLAATNWEMPISLVPCLSWSTASCVFTQGVMSGAIPWHVLQEQFFKNNLYHDEISKLIVSPEKAYQMGQDFVINYSKELEKSKVTEGEVMERLSQASTTASTDPSILLAQDKNNNNVKLTEQLQEVASQNDFQEAAVLNSSYSSGKRGGVLFTKSSSNSSDSSSSNSLSSSPSLSSLSSSSATEQTSTTKAAKNMDSVMSSNRNQSLSPSNKSTETFISTTSKNDSHKNQRLKSVREELGRRLSLSYAYTKQSQQSVDKAVHKDKNKLTLGHAVAKSKILFSRNNEEERKEEWMKKRNLQEESYEFMRGVMDECTHLGNFSVPVDPELVIIVSATQDAYIPRDGVVPLDKLWPGCEVRYVDQGHVGAVLLHQGVFRRAVQDSFEKQMKKYYPDQFREFKNLGSKPRKPLRRS